MKSVIRSSSTIMYFVTKLCSSVLLFLDMIQFCLVSTVLTLYYFAKMIIPLKKKDITGQLALVY